MRRVIAVRDGRVVSMERKADAVFFTVARRDAGTPEGPPARDATDRTP